MMRYGTGTKERAAGRWRDILPKVGIDARYLDGKHHPCPMCGGKDRFRFILKSRSADGFWVCNQCTPQPRPGIELVMKFAGKDFLGAARIVDEIIGGNRYMPLQPRADQKIDMLHRYRFPIEMWRRGNVIRPDDVSDRWLHNRGLGMDAYPPCLRTSSRERYRDSDRGDLISWHPCMLALVRDAQGKPITIARTYLTEDGQKADVPRPRKAVSPFGPSPSIRLAPSAPLMGIAEGIETALAASRLFQMPMWSVLNTGGIETFEPPPIVEKLVIFADNDTAGMRGQLAAAKAVHRLIDRVEMEVCIPPGRLKDWNDVLMEGLR